MKKTNIRGKELRRLGFPENEVIGLVVNIVQKYYRKYSKGEVLDILSELIKNPESFLHHENLSPAAKKLINPVLPKKKISGEKPANLLSDPKNYLVYGSQYIESEALMQMETAMRLPISVQGALMPDAHSGYGLPIGGVLAAKNAVIPYGVGMDIGCRMSLSVYDLPPVFIDNNRKTLKSILIENTKFGRDEFREKKDHPVLDSAEFREVKFLRSLKDIAYSQLGTSGSGNHFVDIGLVKITDFHNNNLTIKPGVYLGVLSHSGSRNLGATIAKHYTRIAQIKCNLQKPAQNLAWLNLDSEEGVEYWRAMCLAGEYAAANHQIIHKKIEKALAERAILRIENHHNFAWKEKTGNQEDLIIHRKGATPAGKGIYGIIPGSMILPGFVVRGKGNEQSLNSASHGAGRQMSRTRAKSSFTRKQILQQLKKAGVELIGGGTDEAPGAYKDITKVMEFQKDLVEIVGEFHPRIVRMSH